MTFETLWAGWRSSYVSSITPLPADPSVRPAGADSCVFCGILSSAEPDAERHVVHAGQLCSVVLNAYPYATGHLLVLPNRHVRELEELEEDEAAHLWSVSRDAVVALKRAYGPEGLNLGMNLGRAAGAGVPDHLHVHALPRWVGDTSFVTAVASLRVMPESLAETWSKLRDAWPRGRESGRER